MATAWKGRIRGLVEALRREFPAVDIRVLRVEGAIVRLVLGAPRRRPIIAVVVNVAREALSSFGPDHFRSIVDRVYAAADSAPPPPTQAAADAVRRYFKRPTS